MSNSHDWYSSGLPHIWLPYTQMKTAAPPVPIVRGEGALLFDENGKQYIDAVSSWWVNIHGHCQPAIAKAIGLDGPKGALVADVSPNSPAQKAGLQSGDVILSVNGTPIQESNQLRMDISMMGTNQALKLQVFRNGKVQDLNAETAALPNQKVERASNETGGSASGIDGVSVENLNPEVAQQVGVAPNTTGVVITGVDPSSAAASSGLKEGDVIQEVNHKKVTNADDFASAMQKSKGDSLLLINRAGNKIYLAV